MSLAAALLEGRVRRGQRPRQARSPQEPLVFGEEVIVLRDGSRVMPLVACAVGTSDIDVLLLMHLRNGRSRDVLVTTT